MSLSTPFRAEHPTSGINHGLSRRSLLQSSGAGALWAALIGLGVVPAAQASARVGFQVSTLAGALRELGVAAPRPAGSGLQLTLPEMVDNSAAVAVSVRSQLPGTSRIALLVERNPAPLVAVFEFSEKVLPEFELRIKVAQSSDVIALVSAQGQWYLSRAAVAITLGGCGS